MPKAIFMSSTDRSLVLRVRSGDELAATELYDRYAARVLGLVKSQMADMLRAQTEPDDIVQSVFKSVFRGMSAGNYDAPQGGTLWQLMAVIAVHKVRRNARRRTCEIRDVRRHAHIEDLDQAVAAEGHSWPEMESAMAETFECLLPAERDAVVLRVKGYSIEEIATQLNKSRRTVERLLQHARTTLAQELCQEDGRDDLDSPVASN
jgi:RNA polymerase sigma-70 factor, ECF subfamily